MSDLHLVEKRGAYDGSAELVMNREAVLAARASGVSISELGRRYGVVRATVKQFLARQESLSAGGARRYTAAEKRAVQRLHVERKWGAKRIVEATGLPESEVRFWLYGTGLNPRVKAAKKKSYYRARYNDWASWRSHTTRSSLLRLVREKGGDRSTVPSAPELKAWIEEAESCEYCGAQLTEKSFSVDHAQPVSRGGGHSLENLRATCAPCNGAKGAMSEEEFVAFLAFVGGWDDGGKNVLGRLRAHGGWQRKAA